jgi:hypothetical protein
MGTDIHFKFQKKDAGGSWQDIETNYDGGRHYLLFAVLADVRNGYGFAGIVTHEPLVPITDTRGLPRDIELVDDYYRKSDEFGFGDHSHSWLTSTEMLEWFKTAPKVLYYGYESMYFDAKLDPSKDLYEDTREQVAYFFDEVKRLHDLHGEVRFVFGFDS